MKLVVLVLLLVAATVADAAAALDTVGSEAPVGANATGEACRVRLMGEDRGVQRFNLFCDGWSTPSGAVFRFRAPRDYTIERGLTDSSFQRSFEGRLEECSPLEKVEISGAAAALRQCRRREAGWPVVVMAALVGQRGYAFETFPTNVRVLETAVATLEGRAAAAAPRDGRLSTAIRRAESIVGPAGKLLGIQDIGAADALWRLGKLSYRAGNFGTGESTFRRLLEIHERVVGPNAPGVAGILAHLALNLSSLRRFEEAEQLLDRAGKTAGLSREEHLSVLLYRSNLERHRNRPAESVRWSEEGVRFVSGSGENSNQRAWALGVHALALEVAQRHTEAIDAGLKSLAIVQQVGNDPEWRTWWAADNHQVLGLAYRRTQKYDESRRHFKLAIEGLEMLFGEAAPRAIENHVSLGRTELEAGAHDAALTQFRRAAELQLKHRSALEGARPVATLPYVDTLMRVARERPDERQTLYAELLTAIQIPRSSDTAKALRAMATRVGSGDPKLAAVTRGLQDQVRHRALARTALAREMGGPPDQRQPAREAELKRQVREAEEGIEKLEAQLQSEFPRYAALSAERPLPADAVRALLRPDEALITFFSGGQGTSVIVVRPSRIYVQRVPLGTAALEADVKALRHSLDLAADDKRRFDVARARALHDALLGPVAAALTGVRHLLTVPTGALMSLPLGVLVTGAPASPDDYRTAPFLANSVAISVLPSVASLRDLRAVAARSQAPLPFIGFADPEFSGQGAPQAVGDVANVCRQNQPLDPALLRGLPRLPETADEVRRIASTLGAAADSVVLGAAATERRVRDTDLTRYRVVAFATHGLLPGELRCQSEPALAMTPPATATPGDDGLLDASEVATLKLDADWVVLSACNTAGPDGSLGGEGLSGLARAFFYAGARAVVATHWAIASKPTVDLTTSMFAAYTKEPNIGRAEAMRRAQAALRAQAATSHPFFWAPFVVVGDGGGSSN